MNRLPVLCASCNLCVSGIINAPLCPQAVEGERGLNNGEVKNDEYEHDSSDEEVR